MPLVSDSPCAFPILNQLWMETRGIYGNFARLPPSFIRRPAAVVCWLNFWLSFRMKSGARTETLSIQRMLPVEQAEINILNLLCRRLQLHRQGHSTPLPRVFIFLLLILVSTIIYFAEKNALKQQPTVNGEAMKSPPISPRLSLSKWVNLSSTVLFTAQDPYLTDDIQNWLG